MTDADLPHPLYTEPGTSQGGHSLSDILSEIAGAEGERVSIGELLHTLGHRALAALMFIFAVPIAFPAPPGLSSVLGAPLLFLTAQLMLGMKPWLPRIIADRSFSRADFAKVVTAAKPWLARAERLMRPRLTFFARGLAKNFIGFLCLVMTIILTLPIPLGNMLPAFVICVFALALIERDGLWAIVGSVLTVAAIWVVWAIVLTAAFWLWGVVTGYLGW